ncbi:hypothetical protein ACOSQ4_014764 [Xanthoceras sorbifolium]
MCSLLLQRFLLLIGIPSELLLKRFHNILVQLEGLGENIRINGRIRSEDRVSYCDDTRILAAQTSYGNCLGFSYVKLEVNEPNWKNKHISLVEYLGEEFIFRSPLQDYQNLNGSRVSMRWVQATRWCIVYTHQGNAKSVKAYLLTTILGVVNGYTEILKRARVRGRGQGGSQSQEDRRCKKVNIGDGNDIRVLAAQTSKGNCIGFSFIELEVNEANWKHKHISLV